MKKGIIVCLISFIATVGNYHLAFSQMFIEFDAPLTVTYDVVISTSGYDELYQGDLQVGVDRYAFRWMKQGEDREEIDDMGHIHEVKHRFAGCVNYHENASAAHWSTRLPLKDSVVVIEETLPTIEWKILPDTRKQNGYTLQKASGFFRGRNYIVWFVPEIPFSAGPWKLQGLPGLIVEAEDEAREVSFYATEIQRSDADQIAQVRLEGSFMDSKTYYTRLVLEPVKRIKMMQAKLPKGSSISISGFKPNFIEKEYEAVVRELMEELNEGE